MKIDKVLLYSLILFTLYKNFFYSEKMSNENITKQINEIYKADIGAIRNLSKLANNLTKDGKLVIPGGLDIKGNINLEGYIKSKAYGINGQISHDEAKKINNDGIFYKSEGQVYISHDDNFYIRNSRNGKIVHIKDDNIITNGTGTFGNAKIGTWVGGNNQYATFAHKDRFSTANDYAFMNHKDGETYINAKSGKQVNLRINNTEALRITKDAFVNINKSLTCYGRYIELYIQPNTGYGAVSEIEVYDMNGNIIKIDKNKVSVSSNDWWDKPRSHWSPQNIVDGDKRNHTDAKGWHPRQGKQNNADRIKIDLGSSKYISHIIIYNRWDSSQDTKLDNSILYVKNSYGKTIRQLHTGKWHRQYSKEFYL